MVDVTRTNPISEVLEFPLMEAIFADYRSVSGRYHEAWRYKARSARSAAAHAATQSLDRRVVSSVPRPRPQAWRARA